MNSITYIFEEVSSGNTYFKEQLKKAASDLKHRKVHEPALVMPQKPQNNDADLSYALFVESLSSKVTLRHWQIVLSDSIDLDH